MGPYREPRAGCPPPSGSGSARPCHVPAAPSPASSLLSCLRVSPAPGLPALGLSGRRLSPWPGLRGSAPASSHLRSGAARSSQRLHPLLPRPQGAPPHLLLRGVVSEGPVWSSRGTFPPRPVLVPPADRPLSRGSPRLSGVSAHCVLAPEHTLRSGLPLTWSHSFTSWSSGGVVPAPPGLPLESPPHGALEGLLQPHTRSLNGRARPCTRATSTARRRCRRERAAHGSRGGGGARCGRCGESRACREFRSDAGVEAATVVSRPGPGSAPRRLARPQGWGRPWGPPRPTEPCGRARPGCPSPRTRAVRPSGRLSRQTPPRAPRSDGPTAALAPPTRKREALSGTQGWFAADGLRESPPGPRPRRGGEGLSFARPRAQLPCVLEKSPPHPVVLRSASCWFNALPCSWRLYFPVCFFKVAFNIRFSFFNFTSVTFSCLSFLGSVSCLDTYPC